VGSTSYEGGHAEGITWEENEGKKFWEDADRKRILNKKKRIISDIKRAD
jgi:sugar lactone lactonase YvrE